MAVENLVQWDNRVAFGFLLGIIGSAAGAGLTALVHWWKSRPKLSINAARSTLVQFDGYYWMLMELQIFSKSDGQHVYEGPKLLHAFGGYWPSRFVPRAESNGDPGFDIFTPGIDRTNTRLNQKLGRAIFRTSMQECFPRDPHFQPWQSVSGLALFYLGKYKDEVPTGDCDVEFRLGKSKTLRFRCENQPIQNY